MPYVGPSLNASFKHAQALQLMRGLPLPGGAEAPASNSPADLVAVGAAKISAAVSAILNLVLDAEFIKGGAAGVGTAGDDTIGVNASYLAWVKGGAGNDVIAVRGAGLDEGYFRPEGTSRPAAVNWVRGGAGDDILAIESRDGVARTSGGGGDDIILITSALVRDANAANPLSVYDREAALYTDGGAGNDVIKMVADGNVIYTDGGAGDDDIEIWARSVVNAFGEDGDDTIKIVAERQALGINGGDGDDTIEVTAAQSAVQGGRGDDTIVLNNPLGLISSIAVHVGDGHDTVTTDSALAIRSIGEVRNTFFDLREASIERIDDATLQITFADRDDSITVRLAGDMAGKPLAIDYYGEGHGLIIRRNDSDAPTLPKWFVADLTSSVEI